MKDETETIKRGRAGAETDREPSRLAARGTLQPLGNLQALLTARMLRPGTGRGPTEYNADVRGACCSAIVNRKCKSKI
jgi:hypothetical protein